jgi:hypothetical protein
MFEKYGKGRSRCQAESPIPLEGNETLSNTAAALSGFGVASGSAVRGPGVAFATTTSQAPVQARPVAARQAGTAVGGSLARSTLPAPQAELADRRVLRGHWPPVCAVVAWLARITTKNACASIAKVMWRYQAS